MDWPKITIVTPTFNRTEFLEETILSVLNQDYPNLEYIIVDGGSSNLEVLEMIGKYEARLAWWISEPDGGHAEAIRKGFDRSQGEIMNWLCSDDCLRPGALRAIAEAFVKHPGTEVVYGNAYAVDEHGAVIRESRSVPYRRLALITAMNLPQPSVFWKRSLYDRVGGKVGGENFEYTRYEPNCDLFHRFANANAKFLLLRRFLSNSRVHPGQVTTAEIAQVREFAWKSTRHQFPFWGQPVPYRLLRLGMKLRQIYWHLRQGELNYMLRGVVRRLQGWWSIGLS